MSGCGKERIKHEIADVGPGHLHYHYGPKKGGAFEKLKFWRIYFLQMIFGVTQNKRTSMQNKKN